MKFVEKKCPNCGAGLKFNDGATSVACEYCNQTYYIEKDEKKYAKADQAHLADAYNFVDEFGKPIFNAVLKTHAVMSIVPFIIFFVAFAGIGITIFSLARNQMNDMDNKPGSSFVDNSQNKEDKWKEEQEKAFQEARKKIVTKLEQIDATSLQTFHDTSKIELKNYDGSCVYGDYKITKNWESVGVYLLVGKETNKNILYDVMSHTYKNKKTGKTTTLYVAVKYDDLKLTDAGIVNNDFDGWTEAPSYTFSGTSFNTAYGYESVEKLYNQLVRSQSGIYTIEASQGIYIES